jgi:hypothetical protein
MQSILDAMTSGCFATTLGSTMTTATGSHTSFTLESMTEAMNKLKKIDEDWEQRFNAVALKAGFDLNRGDRMIVGKGYDLSAVPQRYIALVKVSDLVTPGTAYFMTRELADPFHLDPPTWRI